MNRISGAYLNSTLKMVGPILLKRPHLKIVFHFSVINQNLNGFCPKEEDRYFCGVDCVTVNSTNVNV